MPMLAPPKIVAFLSVKDSLTLAVLVVAVLCLFMGALPRVLVWRVNFTITADGAPFISSIGPFGENSSSGGIRAHPCWIGHKPSLLMGYHPLGDNQTLV